MHAELQKNKNCISRTPTGNHRRTQPLTRSPFPLAPHPFSPTPLPEPLTPAPPRPAWLLILFRDPKPSTPDPTSETLNPFYNRRNGRLWPPTCVCQQIILQNDKYQMIQRCRHGILANLWDPTREVARATELRDSMQRTTRRSGRRDTKHPRVLQDFT